MAARENTSRQIDGPSNCSCAPLQLLDVARSCVERPRSAVRIPSPRARDGRAPRRTLIDSRDLELLIERWKEGNTTASTNSIQPGGRDGDALQTRRSVVAQVRPER